MFCLCTSQLSCLFPHNEFSYLVLFVHPNMDDAVEVLCPQVWLGKLAEEMKVTLRELLKDCLKDAKSSRGGLDPNRYPSQVNGCTCHQTPFIKEKRPKPFIW